jgi:hypothetical protein
MGVFKISKGCMMSGLGNASCGAYTLEKHRFKVQSYEFNFTISVR